MESGGSEKRTEWVERAEEVADSKEDLIPFTLRVTL